jgi:uncharacterized heparinase superfamily protein
MITASHNGYAKNFGLIHRRSILMSGDGTRIDGEDALEPVSGGDVRGDDDFAVRFHLHPNIKASRLADGRAVMLVLPNRDVWMFEALDDPIELEDSVFLAGSDGPRRTTQVVIRERARQAPRVRWSIARSATSPTVTSVRRTARREPELPL